MSAAEIPDLKLTVGSSPFRSDAVIRIVCTPAPYALLSAVMLLYISSPVSHEERRKTQRRAEARKNNICFFIGKRLLMIMTAEYIRRRHIIRIFLQKAIAYRKRIGFFAVRVPKKPHITVLRLPDFAARRTVWLITGGKRNLRRRRAFSSRLSERGKRNRPWGRRAYMSV